MGCPDVETVQAYLGASLPDAERGAVEAHAQSCATCSELIAALAATRHTKGPPDGAAAPAEEVGARVGRYVIEGRLGAGAMGVVYAAHDPELARGVALKLLKVDSEDRRARLVREAQALARISHPNVCAVYDIGSSGGRVAAARGAREAFVTHRDRFAGQPGWAKKAVKVAESKIADVDRWLAEHAP